VNWFIGQTAKLRYPCAVANPAIEGITMKTRTQEQILADLVANTGRAAQLRRKLAANQSRNWFLALVLHSFGRFAERAQLSDLEAGIINAFKENGYDNAELIKQGKLAAKLPSAVRAELFPPGFAALSSGAAFTLDQLRAAAPGIVTTMLAQPNVAVVDVEGIHAGRTRLRDVRMPSEEVLRRHASAATVAIEPNARAAAAAVAGTFKIKATKFRCNHRATDSVFDPKNEFYVIFGSLGSGVTITTQSQIFENVDSGDTRNFSALDGNIWGRNGAAEPLPAGEIGVLVSAWEHDSGDTTQVRAGVAAAFAAASGILAASGVAAWVGALVAGIGGMVTWLVGFMDDDHIADQVFAFNTALLAKQLSTVGSSIPTERRFTDGNADYTITITSTHVS
jgi:hypothetical protein